MCLNNGGKMKVSGNVAANTAPSSSCSGNRPRKTTQKYPEPAPEEQQTPRTAGCCPVVRAFVYCPLVQTFFKEYSLPPKKEQYNPVDKNRGSESDKHRLESQLHHVPMTRSWTITVPDFSPGKERR